MFGLSVAYWGLLSYVAFIACMRYKPTFTLPLAAAMLGAELYFLWIMATVIHIYCMFCLIQFATVIVLFSLTIIWHVGRAEFALPGRLLSAPVVAVVMFAALVAPVYFSSSSGQVSTGEFVTYTGDINSTIRVELYSDYQCGYCKRLEPEIDKLIKNHPDVLLVFRDFVIGSHQLSPVAVSYANGVAFTKGREEFVKTRREMFESQDNLYEYLKQHLDSIEFTAALKDKVNNKVNEDMNMAESLGIFSTPSMVIYRGDKVAQIIRGLSKYEKFSRFLKK
jgi:protein-disulfide isomerase